MSIWGSQSSTPSILKKSSTIRERLKTSQPKDHKVRFLLPNLEKAHNTLQDHLQNKNRKSYEDLICSIRDSDLSDTDLTVLLKVANECIPLLNNDLRLFLDALLAVRWTNRDDNLVDDYQSFLVNLLAAHSYHSKVVIDHLVKLFIPDSGDVWIDGQPTEADAKRCAQVHSVLGTLLKIVPMCRDIFLSSLISHYPYFKKGVHINEYYLHNLLTTLSYQQRLRPEILHLIFSKLVLMDVNAPREIVQKSYEIDDDLMFPMDDSRTIVTNSIADISNNVLVETLDVCLNLIFNYILNKSTTQEAKEGEVKDLYRNLLKVFDDVILPTYNCHHVQFCWFLLCSLKAVLVEAFIDHLWKKVTDPSVPAVLRQSSVEYIASLVARASYVTLRMLKSVISQLSEWVHAYINTQDGLDCVNSDLRVHAVFYSVCQALFYAVTFRHKELIGTKRNMLFLQNLNFSKMVTSRLNPLKVCQQAVVQNFATFTRNYQLAYCYSIIEHNSRNLIPTIYKNERGSVMQHAGVLEANYPFDPYILVKSSEKIKPLFREFEEFDNAKRRKDMMDQESEVDDFLDQDIDNHKRSKFSYGTSPGYKY